MSDSQTGSAPPHRRLSRNFISATHSLRLSTQSPNSTNIGGRICQDSNPSILGRSRLLMHATIRVPFNLRGEPPGYAPLLEVFSLRATCSHIYRLTPGRNLKQAVAEGLTSVPKRRLRTSKRRAASPSSSRNGGSGLDSGGYDPSATPEFDWRQQKKGQQLPRIRVEPPQEFKGGWEGVWRPGEGDVGMAPELRDGGEFIGEMGAEGEYVGDEDGDSDDSDDRDDDNDDDDAESSRLWYGVA